MNYTEQLADMQPLAQEFQRLPEEVRTRIAYIIEGALIIQEATQTEEPQTKVS